MLTARFLDVNLNKLYNKDRLVAHRVGLYARIRKTGKISFVYRYVWNDKQKTITIGKYPALSIKDAAEIVAEHNNNLEKDIEPGNAARVKKLEVISELTIEQAIRKWHAYHFRNHKKLLDPSRGQPRTVMAAYENHIFPKLGKILWDSSDRRIWSEQLLRVAETAPFVASLILTAAKQASEHLHYTGFITVKPLEGVTASRALGIKKNKRKRVLEDWEINLVWKHLNLSRVSEKTKILFQLCLIYGCRTMELRLAERDHFDFKKMIWTVPEELTKVEALTKDGVISHIPNIRRPILDETAAMIKRAMMLSNGARYVFTQEKTDKPVGGTAMLKVSSDITNRINKHELLTKPFKHWTKHDLRRTLRTNMSRIAPQAVAEKMMGHVFKDVQGTYDHHDYLDEMKEYYQIWYNKLMKIVNDSDVIAFQKVE